MQQKSIQRKLFGRRSFHSFAVMILLPPDPSWYFQSPSTLSISPLWRRLKTVWSVLSCVPVLSAWA
jgi:hypothetical protein